MESEQPNGVHYERWNDDNIKLQVEPSESAMQRVYSRACVGRTGIFVKTAGCLAALVAIYIIGYVTGYYVHKC
ncbi:small integral membrane protein 1 [Neosynchiropus ocellatus]